MKSHELAELLLKKPDVEVYLMKEDCYTLKDLEINRRLFVNGIVEGEGKVWLTFRGMRTEEEEKIYVEKRMQLEKTHGLKSSGRKSEYASDKDFAKAVLKEAVEKGYTVLCADEPDRDRKGLLVYQEFDGVELAYNPSWPREDGVLAEAADALHPDVFAAWKSYKWWEEDK